MKWTLCFDGSCCSLVQTTSVVCECRCVRYYMNFDRAMAVLKEVLLQEGRAFNARDKPGAGARPFFAVHCNQQIVYTHAPQLLLSGHETTFC